MSNRLPNVPPWITGPAHDYLVSLVDAMDRELSQRRELQDGILYVAEEKPLHIIGANGVRYELTVDASGELTISPAPQQSYVVGGGVLHAGATGMDNGEAGALWQTPTLQNGWVNYGGSFQTARFRKLDSGLVLVQGLVKDGTTTGGTTVFTLPAGYRPANVLIITTSSGSAWARVDIGASGNLSTNTGVSSSWLALNFQFYADQ